MSAQAANNEDDDYQDGEVQQSKPQANGGAAVSADDIRALLAQEQEKNRRLEAERNRERSERNRVEAQVSTHQTARFDAEEQAVSARISAADAEAAGLRRDLSAAMSEGKFDDVAEIQDKLAELRAKQLADRQYKTFLEGEKTRLAAAPPPSQSTGIDLSQYTSRQRAWIRKHPEFMEDEQLRRRTFAAHQLAVAEGLEEDSDEYFDLIDEIALRGRKKPEATAPARSEDPDDGSGHEGTRQPAPRRERPMEVPVTRSQPGEGQRADRPVKLTAEQKEAADMTLSEHPTQGYKDKNGNWVPDRYTVYDMRMRQLKAQGRL